MRYALAFLSLVALAAGAACSSETPAPPANPDAGDEITYDAGPPPDPVVYGQQLFRNFRCANCHGVDGKGSPTYLAPTLIGRTAEDLRETLTAACSDPNSLTECHPLKLPDVKQDQLEAIAAYIATLVNSGGPELPGPPCTTTPGAICTVAGNGVAGNKRDRVHLGREQNLFWPQNVAVDPQGRAVITDWNNYVVRRLENTGCEMVTDSMGRTGPDCPITNIIGTGGLGDSCTSVAKPVLATDAVMNHPVGVNYLTNGDIVLWGWHQWKIKLIPMDANGRPGEMYCVFGNARGFSGDGMPAGTNFNGMNGPVRFNLPSSSVRDKRGHWYVSDQANLRIRIIRADADDLPLGSPPADFVRSLANNVVTTFAGGEPLTSSGASRRTVDYATDSGDGGPAQLATFNVQFGFDAVPQMRMAYDEMRDLLYVADSENNRVRVIDLNRDPPIIDTFAGGGEDVAGNDVDARSVRLRRPADVDVVPDGSGDIVITDSFNHCVRWVDQATRRVHTVAGQCGPMNEAYEGDGGPALAAKLAEPGGSGVAADGTVYIADTLNHRVRRVNPTP